MLSGLVQLITKALGGRTVVPEQSRGTNDLHALGGRTLGSRTDRSVTFRHLLPTEGIVGLICAHTPPLTCPSVRGATSSGFWKTIADLYRVP